MSNYDYIFGILDGEYILQVNKNLMVAEVKKPYEKYFKIIKDLENQLEDEEDEDTIDKLEKDILQVYSKIDFDKLKPIDPSILFGMFLSSVMKNKRDWNVKYPIILFDKTPYYHKTAIENYKDDRYNSTQLADEIEEKLKDVSLSVNRRFILEYDKQVADYDTDNFWKYQEVKRSFIESEHDNWADAGFHCICKRGYEADQLAYFLSELISNQYQKDGKTNGVLLSADKDWANFQLPGIIFTSIWNGNLADRHYGKLTDEWNKFHSDYKAYAKEQTLKENWTDITRYDYGILYELFISSHNNATLFDEQDDDFRDILIEKYIKKLQDMGGKNRTILKPMAKNSANVELFFRIINGCKNKQFKSYQVMKNAYKAMNVKYGKTVDNGHCDNIGTSYFDDLKPLCMGILGKCNKYKRGEIINLCENHEISLNMMNYSTYISSLKVVR